jgi:hypothetical protein
MTNFWALFKVTRDSALLAWTKYLGVAVALAPMAVDLAKDPYDFPPWLIRAIQVTALVVSISSAQHRTSGLPGEK